MKTRPRIIRQAGLAGTIALALLVTHGGVGRSVHAQCDPQETFKLLAGDGAASDYFGYAVGVSGNTAIVGAYHDDDNGTDSGSAYLFDTVTGNQIAKLLPADGAAAATPPSSAPFGTTTMVPRPDRRTSSTSIARRSRSCPIRSSRDRTARSP